MGHDRDYERPTIVRRERVEALLGDTAQSDNPPPDNIPSDVRKKDNIVPVAWGDQAPVADYESPAITRREQVAGLADGAQSDLKQPPDGAISDVRVKDHIVPVRW